MFLRVFFFSRSYPLFWNIIFQSSSSKSCLYYYYPFFYVSTFAWFLRIITSSFVFPLKFRTHFCPVLRLPSYRSCLTGITAFILVPFAPPKKRKEKWIFAHHLSQSFWPSFFLPWYTRHVFKVTSRLKLPPFGRIMIIKPSKTF